MRKVQKMKKLLIVICLSILLLLVNFEIEAQNFKKRKTVSKCPSVRYVIADNWADEDTRHIDIVLDKPCFSEQNLTTVFKLVSARFLAPKIIDIRLFTDMRDIPTPEERDEGGTSESPTDEITYGNQAVATLENKKGFFYVYYKDGRFKEIKIK